MTEKHGEDLIFFEKMWRQNFVDSMKPQFLPYMWSVDAKRAISRRKYRLDAEGNRSCRTGTETYDVIDIQSTL